MSAPSTGSAALGMRIVRGEPSDEELAAVFAVLAGLDGATTVGPAVARRGWADQAHQLRAPLRPGPGAWRAALRDHDGCAW